MTNCPICESANTEQKNPDAAALQWTCNACGWHFNPRPATPKEPTYQTETVPTNTLNVGDLILCHGGLFRVFQVKRWDARENDAPSAGHTQSNYCHYIGEAFPGYRCQIPEHWRDGRPAEYGRPPLDNFWNEQGNGLARSTRVIAINEPAILAMLAQQEATCTA